MATVEETFGKMPRMEFDIDSLKLLSVDPEKVWVNYDEETDSMIMYVTGKPVRSIAVLLDDNFYVMVDPKTKKAVGLQFEAWEREFVPAFKEVRETWPEVKPRLSLGFSPNLRMLMLWILMMIQFHPDNAKMSLQPA